YFAAHHLLGKNGVSGKNGGSAVSVTGSHNPPDYNGLKMVLGGTTLSGEDIQRLRIRIEQSDFSSGSGKFETADIRAAYLERILSDVKLARPLRIGIDCGNG